MLLCFRRAALLLAACIMALCILFPVFSQEDAETGEELILMEGEGITVTGTPETTQQMAVVTREEIERRNAPDLAALLQETLNLGVTRYGGYGTMTDINLRGFDSERIAFLIDGVPANSPLGGEFDLSRLDLDAIERIEVIYGGSDSKYNVSGSMGGVINIITVKEQKQGLRIGGSISNTSAMPGQYIKRDGTTGSPQWQDLLDAQNITAFAGLGTEKASIKVNVFANRAENHFLYQHYSHEIRRKESNEVMDTGSSVSLVYTLPDYSKLIASADFYHGDKNIPINGYSSIAEKQQDFSSRQNLMFDMPRAFRDDLSTEVSVTHSWETLNYEPRSGGISRHDQRIFTLINRWGWYPLTGLTLRAGGDYRYVTLNSTGTGDHDRHDGGLYLTAEYAPHRTMLIIPSIKAVFSSGGAEPVVPVPKIGLSWQPADSLSFKNNYFRSFKHPDFEDLYWNGAGMHGKADLKPEDGWGGDFGAAYHYKKWVNIESTFFTQWTEDSIHWYGTSPQNVGEAIFFGLDSKVRSIIPLSAGPFREIGLSLSYQYLLSYLLSYGYTWADEKRIPYMPMHTIGASIDISWGAKGSSGDQNSQETAGSKSGSLLISGHYESTRFANTSNVTKLDPYFLLNVNVNQQIGKNLTVFAVGRNLLNTFYESFDEYPMPGITVTLGVRFNVELPKEKK